MLPGLNAEHSSSERIHQGFVASSGEGSKKNVFPELRGLANTDASHHQLRESHRKTFICDCYLGGRPVDWRNCCLKWRLVDFESKVLRWSAGVSSLWHVRHVHRNQTAAENNKTNSEWWILKSLTTTCFCSRKKVKSDKSAWCWCLDFQWVVLIFSSPPIHKVLEIVFHWQNWWTTN